MGPTISGDITALSPKFESPESSAVQEKKRGDKPGDKDQPKGLESPGERRWLSGPAQEREGMRNGQKIQRMGLCPG